MSAAAIPDDPFFRRELRGAPLVVARAAVAAIAAPSLLLFLRGVPPWLERNAERARQASDAAGGNSLFEPFAIVVSWIGLVSAVAWCALAALILWKRSRDLLGISLAVGFLALGLILADPNQVIMGGQSPYPELRPPSPDPMFDITRSVVWLLTALTLFWAFAFPDGRLVPSWSLALVVPWMAWSLLRIPFPVEFSHTRYGPVGALVYFAFPAAGLIAQIYRFMRRSDAVQQQQLKWLLYGGSLLVAAWTATVIVPIIVPALAVEGPSAFLYRTASRGWLSAMSILLPVSLAIAIFRQGLLNIDLIINRTVMYGLLTVLLVAAFVVLGSMAQGAYALVAGQRSDVVAFAVAVPIAMSFLPLRARMQSIADRFLADRTVLTLLFLDIAHSTARAAELGDRPWRDLLERFRSVVRREIRRHGGREIDTAGDGFFITFEAPGRAIRCAVSAVREVTALGLEARAGLHIGECEVHGAKVSGISVHTGARVMAAAEPGEVLVSRTLRDLVSGSDIRLRDRGLHGLRGVPGRWHLYSVARA